jgi:hypothetical protein
LTLEPFNDIEAVATVLGIPFDATVGGAGGDATPSSTVIASSSSSSVSSTSSTSMVVATSSSTGSSGGSVSLDPRSPEFKDILARLAKAAVYLHSHRDILDCERYLIWLEKLEHRACSLIARSMREIIEKAAKSCHDLYQMKLYQTGNKFVTDDAPIESSPLYQKFRGLSYRMRELNSLLLRGSFAEALQLNVTYGAFGTSSPRHQQQQQHRGGGGSKKPKFPSLSAISGSNYSLFAGGSSSGNGSGYGGAAFGDSLPVLVEVKQGYVSIRSELLLPFIKDAWLSSLASSAVPTPGGVAAGPSGGGASSHNSSGIDLGKLIEETKGLKLNTSGGGGVTGNSKGGDSTAVVNHNNNSSSSAQPKMHVSLCTGIRQAFSTLLRVTQLEQQLFESLFSLPQVLTLSSGDGAVSPTNSTSSVASTPTTSAAASSSSTAAAAAASSATMLVSRPSYYSNINNNNNATGAGGGTATTEEVNSIIEGIANTTRDFLRPFIIRECSVDELCRVVAALSEDVRSQMLGS